VIRCLNLAEARHPCESDAVVDDPKQLPIGIALHSLTGEICGTWVHPLSRWRLSPAVDPVAYAAIQAEMCTSCFDTVSRVNRRRGNSVAAGQANDRAFGQIRYACFKRARFLQRRQTEMHQSNSDQHHTRRNRCPNDSRPHLSSRPLQVTKPRCAQVSSATQRPKRDTSSLKKLDGSEASSDVWSAWTLIERRSTSSIVEAGNPDERGWVWQRRFNTASVVGKSPSSIRRVAITTRRRSTSRY
jgi:hypothetical protein